ncbi:hypothetical protein SNE40_018756 [Patella caerulea]|uniref:Zinc finger CCHC domain-containing protein 7 n=1 Tax=Patella caerulea TaxID=87958 RepID=A0AAN8J811_PATCE
MFADSEDDGGPDASSHRTYDIDSLNDSDREELEHALYSQIHFEQHENLNLENEIRDHINYPVYIPTVYKDIFNVDINSSSSTDNFPIKTKDPIEILSDEKNILSVEKPNKQKGKVLVKETLSKLKVASVNKLIPNKKNKNAKKVRNQSLKAKNNYNEKADSKYSLKTSVNAKSIKSQKLITGLKNILNSSSASQKNKNKKVLVLSDVEKSESESDEDEVPSASEDEMSSSFMYASDSDSDSSSMCSKTFGRDRLGTDIKLNIDDPSDADIDDVIAIHSGLSSESEEQNDIDKWQISEQDILGSRSDVFRYYKYDAVKNVRCKNCREKDHLSRDCPKPKVIVCYLCGQRDHMSQACTQPICYNCSKPGHVATDCKEPQYKWFKLCTRCEMPGHQAQNCPDLWRRFHLTTTVCDPVKQPIRKNSRKFCCNCGSNKHFGYECNRAPMSNHAQITYPFILSYKPLKDNGSDRKPKTSTKKYFDDDEDDSIYEPFYKKRKIQLINNSSSKKGSAKKDKKNKGKVKLAQDYLSLDPLKNFRSIMKSYKKGKKGKSEIRNAKIEKNKNKLFHQQSSFVNSAGKSANVNDKLYLYTDKKLKGKNKKKQKKQKGKDPLKKKLKSKGAKK